MVRLIDGKTIPVKRWVGAQSRMALSPELVGEMINLLEEHAQWKRFGL